MVTLGGRPLQHQQSQFVLLAHHQLGHARQLLRQPSLLRFGRESLGSLEVDIHTHRLRGRLRALQRTVGVRQTGVVHLHQLTLLGGILFAHGLQRLQLPVRIASVQIFLSC